MPRPLWATLAALLLTCPLLAQTPKRWDAQWIDVPGTEPQSFGVYHFRRTVDLASSPAHFVVRVSADNRYQVYVNGQRVSVGPARGDLNHWRYETVDLAPHLHSGPNVLAAVVWNDGPHRAIAQVSNRTGFLLAAQDAANNQVNTGTTWRCAIDRAYTPRPYPQEQRTGYYALAANEQFDAGAYPWGWEQPGFNDSSWVAARPIGPGAERYARDAPNAWMLVPSQIPPEEQTPEHRPVLRRTEGAEPSGFPAQPVNIPAHTKAVLLLDESYLTTAYPELLVSSGRGSTVDLQYAETLYQDKGGAGHATDKGNRNDIEGKQFFGPSDRYLADGGEHRLYRPLFWRTFRYIQLTVETADAPLALERFSSTFTAYPFQRSAAFSTTNGESNTGVQRILDTGWRTARLCAHETYMDCPYYEQLQYSGDARIQMMVSLYMTGDARLMRNGIALLNSSRTAEGATYSRAPSALPQYIPPFSLWWIGMVHDYWMYVDDRTFVTEMLPGIEAVLNFYNAHQKPNGSLGPMPWWNFVDWVKEWKNGEPPADPDGSSAAAIDLQLLLAYRWAADLERALGKPELATIYGTRANLLARTITVTDWDSARGLYADQPSHRTYSQQVNTLAILARLGTPGQRRSVLDRVFSDPSLAQSSIYFRAYTNTALRETGLGDRYLDSLTQWREMLGQGLTTWAEWSGPDSRSDCHAWGASPNFEMLRTIAGIESAAPGFHRVRIAPSLGRLPDLTAEMPHPQGKVRVQLRRQGSSSAALTGVIELPPDVSGDFVFAGRTVLLHPGLNRLP